MTKSFARIAALFAVLTLGLIGGGEAQAQKKVRFAYPSSADMGDVPSLLAWEQLKKQGIEVVPTFFPKTDLAVQAVVAGEADIGSAAGIAAIRTRSVSVRWGVTESGRFELGGLLAVPWWRFRPEGEGILRTCESRARDACAGRPSSASVR